MIIYLVRHTPVEVEKGVCYGQSEVALKHTYPADLQALKKKLSGVRFDAIFSSPLERCAKLANDFAAGSKVHIDRRLLELDFGDWELQAWDAIDGEEARQWADNFDSSACPNGESFEDLKARAVSFLDDITASGEDETILVVTHGGVIRCLLAEVLGMQLRDAFKLQIDYAGTSRIVVSEGRFSSSFINR